MLTYAEYRSRIKPLPALEMHLTSACNNHCTFCGEGWTNRKRNPPHHSRAVIRRRMEQAFANGARRVTLKGGEPTLRPDLGEIVTEAREIGFEHVFVFTNARIAAAEKGARWLNSFSLTGVHASIQGGSASSHDASVQAAGAFVQTVKGVRRLIQDGHLVLVNSVLTVHLLDDLENYVRLMLSLRPSEVGFDTMKHSDTLPARIHEKVLSYRLRRPGEIVAYGELSPKFSRYSERLRDAVMALRTAGIPTHLSSFAPCLLPPGFEYLAGGRESGSTLLTTGNTEVRSKFRLLDSMQTKAKGCRECTYDSTCEGVYRSYARAHGLDELRPIRDRREGVLSPFARILQEEFVVQAKLAREVLPSRDGGFCLRGAAPHEALEIVIAPKTDGQAYRQTRHFSILYSGGAATAEELRVVDRIANRLDVLDSTLGLRMLMSNGRDT